MGVYGANRRGGLVVAANHIPTIGPHISDKRTENIRLIIDARGTRSGRAGAIIARVDITIFAGLWPDFESRMNSDADRKSYILFYEVRPESKSGFPFLSRHRC